MWQIVPELASISDAPLDILPRPIGLAINEIALVVIPIRVKDSSFAFHLVIPGIAVDESLVGKVVDPFSIDVATLKSERRYLPLPSVYYP